MLWKYCQLLRSDCCPLYFVSGRLVAGHFETLLPHAGNEEYYRRIRMPISLETIEQKLHNREFTNLTELESYVKRMVCNAKEWYNRNTLPYEDAERVRKALSNYMTVLNPAYKNTPGYTATPTPLPPAQESDVYINNVHMQSMQPMPPIQHMQPVPMSVGSSNVLGENSIGSRNSNATTPLTIPKKRGPRPSVMESTPSTPLEGKRESSFHDLPYDKLTFQQAQEKIVESAIRRKDEEDSLYHFQEFINLPPRSLKDYYSFIEKPMSLKKLLKAVQGYKGKNQPSTGVSDFATWSAFEETARLLWENAFSFNEDDSEIYALAEELKEHFVSQLEEAKAVVPEPSQPAKIKLKVPMLSEAQASQSVGARRITLQVPGRGASVDSPGPPTASSVDSSGGSAGVNGVGRVQQDKTHSVTMSVDSPTSSAHGAVKREDIARNSPANHSRSSVSAAHPHASANGNSYQLQNPALESNRRLPGRTVQDAILTSLRIRTPSAKSSLSNPVNFQVLPDPVKMSQSVTLNVPPNQTHLQIVPTIASFVQNQQRQYRLFVMFNNQVLRATTIEGPGVHVYDVQLTIGRVNMVEVHLAVAIPKGQRQENGPEAEVEKVTVLLNVMRS